MMVTLEGALFIVGGLLVLLILAFFFVKVIDKLALSRLKKKYNPEDDLGRKQDDAEQQDNFAGLRSIT